MRLAAAIAFAFVLGACSPAEDQHARDQAHQTAEQAKHDAKAALDEAKVAAEQANRQLDEGLHKAREKVRGALDQPTDAPKDDHR